MAAASRPRVTCASVLFALLIGLSPASTPAADAIYVTVKNTTGLPAADLHVTFAGSGGNIYIAAGSVNAEGCPLPVVTSNPPVVTVVGVIDWGVECVAPGSTVSFIARTVNGPLTVTDAYWTDDTGASIGGGPWDEDPLPSPDPLPFGALKLWDKYVGGERTYTNYRQNEDQYWRVCCRAERWIETTAYYCPSGGLFDTLFETGPWFPINTIISGRTKAAYSVTCEWVWFWGRVPVDCIPPNDPGVMPGGPPPSGFGDVRFDMFDPVEFNLDVRYSDTGGQNWRYGTDFTATFQAMAESLVTYLGGPVTEAPLWTQPQTYAEIGRKYTAASALLDPLIDEVDYTRTVEPNALLDNVYQDLLDLQSATSAVGAHLQTGTATNHVPFQSLGQALTDLANDIGNVTPALRFDNAASHLDAAAGLSYDAADMVYWGINDTIATTNFGSIMNSQVPRHMRDFSMAMWPHIAVDTRVCDYAWTPSSIDAAWVIMTNLDATAWPETLAVRMNSHGRFYIPAMGIPEGTRLRIWFKLPTFLSVEFEVDQYVDGLRLGPVSLVGGDANNDDCITISDLAEVASNIGEGGWLWETSVSPSDVSGDGIVGQADVDIVQYNFGRCGPVASGVGTGRTPELVTLEAFPNPTEGTATVRFDLPEAASVTVRLYNVRGQEVAVVANRHYPAGSNEVELRGTRLPSGMYMCKLTAAVPGRSPAHRVSKLTILK